MKLSSHQRSIFFLDSKASHTNQQGKWISSKTSMISLLPTDTKSSTCDVGWPKPLWPFSFINFGGGGGDNQSLIDRCSCEIQIPSPSTTSKWNGITAPEESCPWVPHTRTSNVAMQYHVIFVIWPIISQVFLLLALQLWPCMWNSLEANGTIFQ